MSYRMINCAPPTSLVDVQAAEAKMGISLPEKYLQHLLKHNGGTPANDSFRYINPKGEDNGDGIAYFYTVGIGGIDDLATHRRQNTMLPAELLEIAYTGVGNMILIGISGDVRGKIFFFDREFWFDEDGADPWYPIIPLADSFDQFMNDVLYEYPMEGST